MRWTAPETADLRDGPLAPSPEGHSPGAKDRSTFGLAPLANRIIVAWGWRRALLAFGAGGLSVLAMAPFHFAPVLFVTLPILVWLIDGAGGATRRSSALSAGLAGWWFGFGYFLIGLHWIGSAFLVGPKPLWALMPFAVLGLAAGLALFFSLGAALARLTWSRGPARVAALAFGLGLSEWLRGHLFTGFPWNGLGQALAATDVTAQVAALVGLHGMTVLSVGIFASPAALVGAGGPMRRLPVALAAGALLLIGAFGTVRLWSSSAETVPGVRLRLVQPGIDQRDKWRFERRQEIMQTYLRLTRQEGSAAELTGITHVIWPESAFPFVLTQEAWALGAIAELLPIGTTLLVGGVRTDRLPEEADERYFNSLFIIDDDGEITGTYDKIHLVPFGEYLPLQSLLSGFGARQLAHAPTGGFHAGRRRNVLPLSGAPAAVPLICYEIIFPGEVLPGGERPGWIVNVTNDAWFGRSIGPYQHLDQARLRAIEEGLPVARVANTGISAVIDPYGRIVSSLPLGAEGILDADLPVDAPRTPYSLLRLFAPMLLIGGAFSVALFASFSRRTR